jgi:hypothetical protein
MHNVVGGEVVGLVRQLQLHSVEHLVVGGHETDDITEDADVMRVVIFGQSLSLETTLPP